MSERRGTAQNTFAHERRPIHSVAEFRPSCVQGPDQRHSVGNEVIESARQVSEARVMAPQRDDVRVREIDGDHTLLTATPLAEANKLVVSGALEPCSQDITFREARRSLKRFRHSRLESAVQ